jgi:ParB family chromosome partitioning protein
MSDVRNKLKSKSSKLAKTTAIVDHPAKINYQNGDYKRIPLDLIKTDPNQPRKMFDSAKIEELSNSIQQHGVLQPIIIRMGEHENDIWLVAGERRFRVAHMAGLTDIPAIISAGNPAEIALIENVQREDLNPIEEANAYKRMIDEFKYTQERLAQIVGKGRSTITEILSINNLPITIQDECLHLEIPKRNLIELARIESRKKQESLFKKLKLGIVNRDDIKQGERKKAHVKDRIIKKLKTILREIEKADLDTLIDKDILSILEMYGVLSEAIEKKFATLEQE